MSEEFEQLIKTIRKLRAPDGCPWDRKQDALSLKKYLHEECQELISAIENGDIENICEEIGDLYFILGMLSVVHSEKDLFSPEDPLRLINEKMIRRHPHVFSNTPYKDEQELRLQWEMIKQQEKKHSS